MRFSLESAFCPTLAVLAALITFITIAECGRAGINLEVSSNFDPNGRPSGQVINCSVDTAAADLDKVATLEVFGPRPYGIGNGLEELARLDIWSKSPELADELEGSDVSVDGDVSSSPPYLTLTWRLPTLAARHAYKCVVNGYDRDGKAASVSTTVQVDPANGGCCHKMDAVQTTLSSLSDMVGDVFNMTEDVSSKVSSLGSRFEDVEASCSNVDGQVTTQLQSLTTQFEEIKSQINQKISSDVQTLTGNLKEIEDRLKSFEQDMRSRFVMLGIDRARFDVSGIYQGRLYLVSKTQEAFNIARANEYCKQSGGYLVELDDTPEYQFVFNLVNKIRGANSFWTGANDIDREGHFVFYNSKKPLPTLTWSGGQPDGLRDEDCMEIRLNFGGLNDWLCNQVGKYVCEVPL
ncbi:C-type lectin [Elysia marginata]|uniref:C-type lectin n=1 Tax=Elysia marginata TaxID=1093978 RepID=A0AAV4EMD8_9GAST|nr:C-type lectin [Elysia marginata]